MLLLSHVCYLLPPQLHNLEMSLPLLVVHMLATALGPGMSSLSPNAAAATASSAESTVAHLACACYAVPGGRA